MKRLFFSLCAVGLSCAAFGAGPEVNIVPKPLSVTPGAGTSTVTASTVIGVGKNAELRRSARIFAGEVAPVVGGVMKTAAEGDVRLAVDGSLEAEAYTLAVTPSGVEVCGGTPQGVFHGLQSLRQLVIDGEGVEPAVTVSDKPYFAHRGGMLDPCRHFWTVDEVKEYIDILAMHKLNKFHWHLTDDQGWRIEIKRYPRLTQVGAWRSKSQIGSYEEKPATFEFGRYGGFYTQDEIREVVAYAAERYITVIPEIEMPGHSLAALTAYPWLGCTNGDESYEIAGWICGPGNVLCPGKESTFEFLENVLDEVVALFPSKLIHIGGDECQHTRWEACPDCQARIAAEGLRDETQLQSYLTHRIDSYLTSKGRQLIGWDEIMEGGLSPGAVIMSWRGTQGGIAAAREYHHVGMTPGQYLYFDKRDGFARRARKPEPLPAAGEDIRLRPGGGALRRGTAIPAGRAGQPLDGIRGDREAGRVPVAAAHLRPLRDRMVARGAQVVGGVLPAAPSGIPCAARRRRGSLSGSATPRHPRRDARRGMFPLHDPPAFPGLPGLLHAQRRHALRLRPRSAGLSGGGRSPRGTTGAQMRRRHPRRTPEHGRHHPPGQPRGVTRRTAGHGYCQKST